MFSQITAESLMSVLEMSETHKEFSEAEDLTAGLLGLFHSQESLYPNVLLHLKS